MLICERRPAARRLRAGPGAARGDDRRLPRARARPRPRHRPAGGVRPGLVRRLDAAAARLRHDRAARGAALRDRLRARRLPGDARGSRARSPPSSELFREEWTASAELWLPAPEVGARMRNPALAATYERLVDEAEAAGPAARRRSTRRGARGARASSPRRSSPPTAACSTARTSPPTGRRSRSRSRSASAAGPSSRPGRGARGRCCSSSSRCSTASTSRPWSPPSASTP